MKRRDFLKGSAAVALGALYGEHLFGQTPFTSGEDREWNLQDHITEWTEGWGINGEYVSPSNRKIFTEKISIERAQAGDYSTLSAIINVRTNERSDIRIAVGKTPSNLKARTFAGVEGNLNIKVPLNDFGERVFYQVFCDGKPLSPVRAFKNSAYNPNPIIHWLSDTHVYMDAPNEVDPIRKGVSSPESALKGDYEVDFFLRAIRNPEWYSNASKEEARRITFLTNAFNVANTEAYIVKNKHPDLIVQLGDEIGFEDWAFKRQVLPEKDYSGNAKKLWGRHRRYWGVLTPLVPIVHASGNHDGENMASNPYHNYVTSAREEIWGRAMGDSFMPQRENYFVVPLANGKMEIYILDVIKNSGTLRPQDNRLGGPQKTRFKGDIEKSEAPIKMAGQHNVLGGWNSYGNPFENGLGPLFTRDDYKRNGVNPSSVEQPEITEMLLENDFYATLIGHNHVFDERIIGTGKNGRPVHAVTVGAIKECSTVEREWAQRGHWKNEYAGALFSPEITTMYVKGNGVWVEVPCVSVPSKYSNLGGAVIGQKLKQYRM